MMLGVLQTNRENILTVLRGIQSQLDVIESALSSNDFAKLDSLLHEAQGKYQSFTQ